MTIKEIADQLQKRINGKLVRLCELHGKTKQLAEEIEKTEKLMVDVILELEPVESLIKSQSPELAIIFESYKNFRKDLDVENTSVKDTSI
jgi:hypothetical protein